MHNCPGDPQPRTRCRWSPAARVERQARPRRQDLGRPSGDARRSRRLERNGAEREPLHGRRGRLFNGRESPALGLGKEGLSRRPNPGERSLHRRCSGGPRP